MYDIVGISDNIVGELIQSWNGNPTDLRSTQSSNELVTFTWQFIEVIASEPPTYEFQTLELSRSSNPSTIYLGDLLLIIIPIGSIITVITLIVIIIRRTKWIVNC